MLVLITTRVTTVLQTTSLIDASIVAQFSHDELGLRTMVTIHDGDAYSKAPFRTLLLLLSESMAALFRSSLRWQKARLTCPLFSTSFDEAESRWRVHFALPGRGYVFHSRIDPAQYHGRIGDNKWNRVICDGVSCVAGVGRHLFHRT